MGKYKDNEPTQIHFKAYIYGCPNAAQKKLHFKGIAFHFLTKDCPVSRTLVLRGSYACESFMLIPVCVCAGVPSATDTR